MVQNTKAKKTEQSIQKAFIKLTNDKGFNKMSVKNIIETAHISRGTFYLHYLDKFDLLAHYENMILTGITLIFEEYPKPHLDDHISDSHASSNAFFQMFKYLYQYRQLTATLMNNTTSNFKSRMKDVITLETNHDFNNQLTVPDSLQIPRVYAQEIISQNILSILNFWLAQPNPEKPETAFQIFLKSRQLSPANLQNLLN